MSSEQRRAQLGRGKRVLLDVFGKALAIFRAILLSRLGQQHLHFLLAHFDAVGLADFRKEQAQAHTAHGNAAVIVLLGFDLGHGSGRIGLVLGFLLKLGPDLAELGFDHARRHVEIMTGGQLIEQRALHLGAGQAGSFLLQLAAGHDFDVPPSMVEAEFGQIWAQLQQEAQN
ncbi:MAG: hypothetical protein RL339_1953, partial [Pseudomonadota bacterium]